MKDVKLKETVICKLDMSKQRETKNPRRIEKYDMLLTSRRQIYNIKLLNLQRKKKLININETNIFHFSSAGK